MDEHCVSATPEVLAALGIVGRSAAFLDCFRNITKLARSKAPVLIEGETGTGKEAAARCLHYFGPRGGQAFIPVNCGALPESMFENELFGHVQGAYTDARSSAKGLVAQAQGGTLFLDELDGLGPRAQIALLRFLEDFSYRPLGGDGQRQADLSIVGATNADLQGMVEAGHFRPDLLFRLSTLRTRVPPLRERRDDIPLLAEHYLYRLAELYDAPPKALGAGFLSWLQAQDWPGNIRELQNCLHREFLLAEGEHIDQPPAQDAPTADFSLELRCFEAGYDAMRQAVVAAFEQQFLERVMRESRGNVSQAARLLGKDRRAVGRLLEKNGIDRTHYL